MRRNPCPQRRFHDRFQANPADPIRITLNLRAQAADCAQFVYILHIHAAAIFGDRQTARFSSP